MNVLLVNPNRERMPWPAVPIGLCTVATALDRAGHDVELVDLTFARDPFKTTFEAARRRSPDVVGITVRNLDNCNFESPVFYLKEIRDAVVRAVRQGAPSARIVIGGSAVNVSPEDCFRYLEVDYALVGEGEEALPRFLAALEAKAEFSSESVPGLLGAAATRDPGKLLRTIGPRAAPGEPIGGRAVVRDLETSARSEAWRWVRLSQYQANGGPFSVQTKRGCALKCSYCVYNGIEGRAYRLRKPEAVVDEIQQATEHGVRNVEFVDSTFNLPLSHGRALLDELARRALPVELSTMGLNPAGVRADFIESMKRAGFKSVMCTPESASDVTLASLNKGYDKGAVIRAADALRRTGLRTFWFFMIGAPGETLDTVRETLEFCEEYVPKDDMVLFTTGIRVYSGTPLEAYCKEIGWFAADDPLFLPSWYLSPELDFEALYGMLVRAAESHPNWMTNAETVLGPAMATVMKGAFRMLGWKGPFWQHLPKLHRLTARSRKRGLAEHHERLRRITDVPHHS